MSGISVTPEFIKLYGRQIAAGSIIAKEGEEGRSMFIIASGRVEVSKRTFSAAKVLATLIEGDFFGEMSIVSTQDRRTATVKALVDTVVVELDRVAFEAMVTKVPTVAINVIKSLVERLREANGTLAALAHGSDFMKISSYLNFLAVEKGQPAPERAPGVCFVFRPELAEGKLNTPAGEINRFLDLAYKAHILARNGDWIWLPLPQYLLPFGEYLEKNHKNATKGALKA